MFGIGMPELIMIFVVAIIVIGPKKLPDVAKALGKGVGEFKKATRELKESINFDETVSDLKENLDIDSSLKEIKDEMVGIADSVKDDVIDLKKEVDIYGLTEDKDTTGQKILAEKIPETATEPSATQEKADNND